MKGEVDFLRIWVVGGARMETGLEGWALGAKSSWWVQDKDGLGGPYGRHQP